MNEVTKNSMLINSIIGENTHFRGDIRIKGLLRIDGDFEGSIKADSRVLIGKSGRVSCQIEADTVVVGGIVRGDLRVHSKVVLLSTCIVMGSIRTPRIIIEEGVLFHGHCIVSDDKSVLTSAPIDDSQLFSIDWGNISAQPSATLP